MNIRILSLAATLALAAALFGCQKESSPVTVSGTVTGAEGKILLLEYLGIEGVTLQDSVTLDASGNYELYASAPQYPEYFRLRIDNASIPFVADSLDKITITADGADLTNGFSSSYAIEGNAANASIKEIWRLYRTAAGEVARLKKEYSNGNLSSAELGIDIEKAYQTYRTAVRKVIESDPSSPAAYFGLMQQINREYIFRTSVPDDSRLFASVANVRYAADSINPRNKHLYSLALQSIATVRLMRQMEQNAANDSVAQSAALIPTEEVGFIDIKLPDAEGREVSLKSVASRGVTVLAFTTMSAGWSHNFDQIVRSLYDKYAAQGLQIYQVNIDKDQHIWRNIIKSEPWINVLEDKGAASPYIGNYSLLELPALFLIDKAGNIVLRAQSIDEFEKRISAELAK